MVGPQFYRERAGNITRIQTHGDDDELLNAWFAHVEEKYRGKTVQKYHNGPRNMLRFLHDQNLQLKDVDQQSLSDYLHALAANCRHFLKSPHGYTCKGGLFRKEEAPPASCGLECPRYEQVKVETYVHAEMPLARFFEWVTAHTDYPAPAFFAEVSKRIHDGLKRRRIREREDPRYPRRALTMDEVGALLGACRHPRDHLVVLLLLKTGARREEVLQLPDSEMHRRIWERERLITVEANDGIKRIGNPHLVIDDQLWDAFQRYFRWKDHKLENAPADDPRFSTLLLGKDGSRPMGEASMSTLWADAGRRAGIRVHPLIDADLTPHSARHTFCRILEEAGFTPFWIARLRGDVQAPTAELRSAWTYAKRTPAEMREAYLERFPRLLVGP